MSILRKLPVHFLPGEGDEREFGFASMPANERCQLPHKRREMSRGNRRVHVPQHEVVHAGQQELERLEKMHDTDEINHLTKKEGLLIERQITRLQTRLSGSRTMKRRPDMLFVVDVCPSILLRVSTYP